MVATEVGGRIRRMGCHEAYQLAVHTLDQYRGTIVACRYFLPRSFSHAGSLAALKIRFRDALTQVVLAQPHLHVGIVGEETGNPAFVRLDRIDLRNHIQWITVDDTSRFQQVYHDTMQTQLDSRFENLATQPGWRMVVLQEIGRESIEVLYVWNHPHHDGSSGKIFHRYLLQYLNEFTSKDKEPISDISEDIDRWVLDLPDPSDRLPPNPEILTSWSMSPGFALRELWKELKPQWIFPPGPMHARWAPIQATPYCTRFCNFTLDSQIVTKIVEACRLHQTTLTGLVQALCLVSLSTALPDMRGFASRTPYDLRHILPSHTKQYPWLKPKEAMCNYVSVIEHEFGPELVNRIRSHMPSLSSDSNIPAAAMELIWSVAARVRREIQARLDNRTHNDLIGIMKLCLNWNAQQQSEMRRMRYLSWLVTNVGILNGGRDPAVGKEEEKAWAIRRAELILSADPPSAALSVSIMTVKGGEMCVTCSWQDCVVNERLGQRFMDDLERWLRAIAL